MKQLNIKLLVPIAAIIVILFSSCKKNSDTESPTGCGNITDADGNVYTAIKIGNQCWMQKNLSVSHYKNGDSIPEVKDSTAWLNLTTGAWCYYQNSSANGIVYGKLYNWYAVHDPRGLAPTGCHVPSDSEWTVLTDFLGGASHGAGDKMKEAGAVHWNGLTGTTGNNSSGFTGLPGGYRDDYLGSFGTMGEHGFWWTSSEANSAYGRGRFLDDTDVCSAISPYKIRGFSVRCLKD